MEKEVRQYNIEFKSANEGMIEGRAIPFNVASPNREGFRETIRPEAVEGVLEKSDIFLVYNHDRKGGFLARNKRGKGSLHIDTREDGVYFSFKPLSDNLSNYVRERIENGDLDEMSWAFTIEADEWKKGADGVWDRAITKFEQIYDFSIVDQSYYGIENAVKCARFAEVQEEERLENERRMKEAEEAEKQQREAEEAAKAAEEEAKAEKLKAYYEQMRQEYADALAKGEEMNKQQ